MGLKGIVKNILKKGPVETWKLYKQRSGDRDHITETQRALALQEMQDEPEMRDAYLDYINRMKDPRAFKEYLKEMHDKCVRDDIPAIYMEASKAPVEDKIIIMEKGQAPSPSNEHIGQVLEEQGRYEVIYMSLGIRETTYLKYYENVKHFVKEAATAKAVLLSTANDFFSFVDLRPETKIIQLWHGVGMFKKVGYSTLNSKRFGPGEKYRQEFDQYKGYSYVTIASENQAWMFEDAMHISADSGVLAPVGISRTDLFFDDEYMKQSRQLLEDMIPQAKGKKIILYAPTFRGTVNNAKAPDRLDVNALAEELSEDHILLIKHHGLCLGRTPAIPEKWNNTFAFDMNDVPDMGIERLLAISDICITDYSSIAFEYSIMEKPIVFFAYDLDEYVDERGMYFNYSEITPGPVCRTNRELIDSIAALRKGFDKDEIHAFHMKYADMCDGHATERTIALIES